MAAPRSRRRRIRLIINSVNSRAITALDNEQDDTIWETCLCVFCRCLPLDAKTDAELTSNEMNVAEYLEEIESTLNTDPTDATVADMVDTLDQKLELAGL